MATVNICDICGEPLRQYVDLAKMYKIKRYSGYSWLRISKSEWEDVSCHESCIKLLLAARDNQLELDKILEDMRCKVVENLINTNKEEDNE